MVQIKVIEGNIFRRYLCLSVPTSGSFRSVKELFALFHYSSLYCFSFIPFCIDDNLSWIILGSVIKCGFVSCHNSKFVIPSINLIFNKLMNRLKRNKFVNNLCPMNSFDLGTESQISALLQ